MLPACFLNRQSSHHQKSLPKWWIRYATMQAFYKGLTVFTLISYNVEKSEGKTILIELNFIFINFTSYHRMIYMLNIGILNVRTSTWLRKWNTYIMHHDVIKYIFISPHNHEKDAQQKQRGGDEICMHLGCVNICEDF